MEEDSETQSKDGRKKKKERKKKDASKETKLTR